MSYISIPRSKELCSVLLKTLQGEIDWSKEFKWIVKPDNGYIDAHGYTAQDAINKKTLVLVRKYTDRTLSVTYSSWPVLFVINSEGATPDECIAALCNDTSIPGNSVSYNGQDDEVYNHILKALLQIVE